MFSFWVGKVFVECVLFARPLFGLKNYFALEPWLLLLLLLVFRLVVVVGGGDVSDCYHFIFRWEVYQNLVPTD